MAKRYRDTETLNDSTHIVKRARIFRPDRLSGLSDELLLKIFSYLSVTSLASCQSLSHRLGTIAGDSQLWKSAYYDRFVRPRASKIPGIRDPTVSPDTLLFSSRTSKWLDDEDLVRRGTETNWKRQYKLRHNWSRGNCDVSEIHIGDESIAPPLLTRLLEHMIVTADLESGLRAWDINGNQQLIATVPFVETGHPPSERETPTSLAIDTRERSDSTNIDIVVGFFTGRFSIYRLDKAGGKFTHCYTHSGLSPRSRNPIAGVAYHSPYLLTSTEKHTISLYKFQVEQKVDESNSSFVPPSLSCSLRSHTAWPPMSLSLRLRSDQVIVSIAFSLPTYRAGWSVGLQEIHLTPEGDITHTRLATAINQGFTQLSSGSSPSSGLSRSRAQPWMDECKSLPTSLSYNHPYLLSAHLDNTLTLYMVNSAADSLEISAGSRLWGHTSSVSGASVDSRGRAVSVSSRGDELRLWELEGGLKPVGARRRLAAGNLSVQVRPGKKKAKSDQVVGGVETGWESSHPKGTGIFDWRQSRCGWVGFDEEKVVLLRGKELGRQALTIYDFT
ncbi:MAG: hypothetical protein M1816_007646 [Peltula sp. TS41687]|nr:MAG: hypothetical protein M1816_007646 [Peltula sp. TS41687]